MMAAEFELFSDAESGGYWFQLKAANGEPVAQSQVYQSVADARKGMVAVRQAAAAATIPDDDGEVKIHSDNEIHMHYRKRPSL